MKRILLLTYQLRPSVKLVCLPPATALGWLASGRPAVKLSLRSLGSLCVVGTLSRCSDTDGTDDSEPRTLSHPCPCCRGRMIIIETFERGRAPRYRPTV